MYSETLLDYAREGIRPLQYASLELLAAILLHNYDLEEADGIIDQIISEFAESECSFTKKLFVDFFEIWWRQKYSIAVIEDKLFDPFIAVAKWEFKSVKMHVLKIIPNLKYLLSDSDMMEEVQSILMSFTEDKWQDLAIKTEEINMLFFKWKKESKTHEGLEELKQFDEERQVREIIIKNKLKTNKVLIEQRKKKEEEDEQIQTKGKLQQINQKNKRGFSSNKNRKPKKTSKFKSKVAGSRTATKVPKKYRRNTTQIEGKMNSATLQALSSEEYKDGSKRNSVLITSESSNKISSESKTGGRVVRKASDPFDYHK